MGRDFFRSYAKSEITDLPDLIVRVFRMKLSQLLNDICTNHVLCLLH